MRVSCCKSCCIILLKHLQFCYFSCIFVKSECNKHLQNCSKSYQKQRKTPEVHHFWGVLFGDPYGI